MSEIVERIKAGTAIILDFPHENVHFVDITTILRDPELYGLVIAEVQKQFDPDSYDIIVSPEARGFLLGAPIALAQKKPFIPIRFPDKLPREILKTESTSEYTDDKPLAVHREDILPGTRVLIMDDLLATCGTALAMVNLIHDLGSEVVGISALYDLPYVPGRVELPVTARAVVTYDQPPAAYLPE